MKDKTRVRAILDELERIQSCRSTIPELLAQARDLHSVNPDNISCSLSDYDDRASSLIQELRHLIS